MTGLLLILLLSAAVAVLAVYAVIRGVGGPSPDVLRAVRVHGTVTAAAALCCTVLLGDLGQLTDRTLPAAPDADPQVLAGGWLAFPVALSPGWGAWLLVLLSPALVAAVHLVAQRTFPAPRGAVRRAGLTPRSTGGVTPRGPLLAAGAVTAVLAAALGVLALQPSVPMIMAPPEQWDTEPDALLLHRATAAGVELLPWFAQAWAAAAAAVALCLAAVARRRALEGLTPEQDRAVREAAAHRILRTGAWMGWLLVLGAWNAYATIREGRDTLARFTPDHAAALPLEAGLVEGVGTALAVATVAVVLGLLLWRPPALAVLRTPQGQDAATAASARPEAAA